jgi:hypothetical protein
MHRGSLRSAKRTCRGSRRAHSRIRTFDCLESRLAPAGDFSTAFALGSAGADVVQAIAGYDGPVVAGSFSGTVNFDPGSGTFNLTSAGGKDIFVASYDRMGRLLWAKGIGGPGDDEANAIALDGSGNAYVTGDFSGTVNFGPATLTTAGGTDIFIAKFDSSGNVLWARDLGGPGDDKGLGIGGDGSYILVTGSFSNTANFDPAATLASSQHTLISAGGTDAFFLKLTTDGTWQPGGPNPYNTYSWAERAGGPGDDSGTAVTIKSSQSYYFFTGDFSGTADLSIWQGSSPEYHTSAGGTDVFVTQLGFWGTRAFLQTFGGPGDDRGTSIALDPNGLGTYQTSYIYVGGFFHGTVDFSGGSGTGNLTSAGGSDAFVARYRYNNGAFVWADLAGGIGDDATYALYGDYSGVFAAGQYTGTVNFATGGATFDLHDAGQGSAFLWRLDPNGRFTSARGMGGTGPARALAVSGWAGFVGGSFQGTADFDQGYGGSFPLTSAGGNDGFVAKFMSTPDMVPIANNDAYSVAAGQTLTVGQDAHNTASSGISSNDVGRNGVGTGLSPRVVTYPQHGTLSPGFYGDFTYTPNASFVGTDTFTYRTWDNSVASNLATVTIMVVPSGTDPKPTLQTIPDRTIYPGQSSLTVDLQGSDADGEALTYSATADTQEHNLRLQLGLYSTGNLYYNWGGKQEKWMQGTGGVWYFITPDGSFSRWDGSNTASGPLVATVNIADYADPSRLYNAQPASANATLGVSGNQVTITPVAGYAGTLIVTATLGDGTNTISQTFNVRVLANTPPTLAAIPDQTMAVNPATLTLTLVATDPDLGPYGQAPQKLTYSGQTDSVEHQLSLDLGLFSNGNLYYNWGGKQEKWMQGTGGVWYFITPDGSFSRWDGSNTASGTLITILPTADYTDPSRLYNAQPATIPVTLGVSVNQLTIAPNSGYSGTFVVIVTVSDGLTTAQQRFKVTVS